MNDIITIGVGISVLFIVFICFIILCIDWFSINDNENEYKHNTTSYTSYEQNNSYYDNPLKYKDEYDNHRPKYTNYDNNVVNTPKYKSKYDRLLHDDRWYNKRIKILDRDNHKCKYCGSTHNLQVHHKYYNVYPNGEHSKPWDYPDDALITLCDNCHKREHERKQIKTYYRKLYKHFV